MMRARKMGVLGALVPIGAIALWGCSTPGADRSPGQTPIVRQVDHVLAVFLCAYASDRLERTGRLREDLRSRGGGPLTVHSIREVVYGARDVDLMQERWQALLFPLQPSSPGVWSLGSGPAIRVARTERDGALGLVIEVRSLAQARPLLAAHGALLKGIDIALVEGP